MEGAAASLRSDAPRTGPLIRTLSQSGCSRNTVQVRWPHPTCWLMPGRWKGRSARGTGDGRRRWGAKDVNLNYREGERSDTVGRGFGDGEVASLQETETAWRWS